MGVTCWILLIGDTDGGHDVGHDRHRHRCRGAQKHGEAAGADGGTPAAAGGLHAARSHGNHTAGFATVTGLSQFDNVSAMLLLPLWSIRA